MTKKVLWFLLAWIGTLGIVLGCFALFSLNAIPWHKMIAYLVGAILQACISVVAFLAADKRRKFLHKISLRVVSVVALVVCGMLGLVVAMFKLPIFVPIVGFIPVLLAQGIFCIFAKEVKPDAVEVVAVTTEQIKKKTAFIRELTVDAKTLMDKCSSEEDKKCAETVYEAIRYSDPMSAEELKHLERQIKEAYVNFESALVAHKDTAEVASAQLLSLLKERNNKCKALK